MYTQVGGWGSIAFFKHILVIHSPVASLRYFSLSQFISNLKQLLQIPFERVEKYLVPLKFIAHISFILLVLRFICVEKFTIKKYIFKHSDRQL